MARRGSGTDCPRSLRSVSWAGGEFRGAGRQGYPSSLYRAARCGSGQEDSQRALPSRHPAEHGRDARPLRSGIPLAQSLRRLLPCVLRQRFYPPRLANSRARRRCFRFWRTEDAREFPAGMPTFHLYRKPPAPGRFQRHRRRAGVILAAAAERGYAHHQEGDRPDGKRGWVGAAWRGRDSTCKSGVRFRSAHLWFSEAQRSRQENERLRHRSRRRPPAPHPRQAEIVREKS